VEDNGRGFHLAGYENQSNSDHLGLIGMKERAELLNGTLDITSRPGEGTQVTLNLPVPAPVDNSHVKA
jgi:two-component system sensor histidine kinase DegS